MDNTDRGFSYKENAKLDMRMDLSSPLKASDILNNYSEEQIDGILYKNADVKFSRKIAKAIVENRPFDYSNKLVELLRDILPAKVVREKNPAKQVFQALRIEVNDELNSIKEMLDSLPQLMNKGGKILIITFHSKEDYLVKKFYQDLNYVDPIKAKLPTFDENKSWSQKIIFPSKTEIETNKRAKSAKLRVITKL